MAEVLLQTYLLPLLQLLLLLRWCMYAVSEGTENGDGCGLLVLLVITRCLPPSLGLASRSVDEGGLELYVVGHSGLCTSCPRLVGNSLVLRLCAVAPDENDDACLLVCPG